MKKQTVKKPTVETIQKHVAILKGLANRKRNNGVLPSYSWLNKNGYFRSYEVMRQYPYHFRSIKRAA